ncbi:molybdopterin-dependent oxidoreductase [Octadecabacter sp. G9-8]|uniref:Molybdopterin-dependent oxidoreductase n=1 Tax=Octadecabacter dasysiphoniae TaxID=2909341 RepID=A0ABS9CQZ1_9RHOB|nr:molybdopterin cofactor-binding domain-containing protein [Octadecabacter dasysiphoniae]MCF2869492.1 molybdopterin-dependent oxidoreductase [Octadecabacter dasysiphoniae]
MSRIGTIARRTFLIGTAAVAGGVAFGTYLVKRPTENPLLDDIADGEAAFNPWVIVNADRVTLIAPHGDKGQGIQSSQAALIAEEMDLEWGDFDVSFGMPSKAYWNTAMAGDVAPFMSTDESRRAETVRGIMGGIFKIVGLQGTGGSTSMPDSFIKLREAGAMARETLKLAASTRTGIPVADLKTKGGAVVLPDGTALKYTELAADAAGLEPVSGTPLCDPSRWRLIGKPMERLDIIAKSTGTLDYGIDLVVPDMVHATVCVNPRQGGSLISYDATAARDMTGVLDIVEVTNGVAVIATNTWYAIQAVNAVEFEWGKAPYPPEQEQHWEAVEAAFSEGSLDSEWRNDGDFGAAIGSVIEGEYRSPYVAHAPLEPLNAIVHVTDDQVEVWSGHQTQGMLVDAVAGVTGHSADQITFHNQWMGGSFGHRLELEHIKQAAEIANQMRGTPVKLTYSREEDFAHDFPRHISMGRARMIIADGKVEGMDLSIAAPSVISSQMGRAGLSVPGPDSQIAAGAWNNPYDIPNYRMRAYRAPELAPVSSWRAVGANAAGFFFDTALDEAIHAAGADPLDERIRLMGHDVSRKVLEAVGEMSSWGGELGPNKGRGIAYVESFGVPTAEVVEVTNTEAGIRIDKVWIALDVGTVVDPVNFENLVQGGVIFGLGHAMNSEITYSDGIAQQSNYHDHEAMRLFQCPEIEVRGLENAEHIRGVGEPPVPPAAPALGNAIFAATGQRIRELPFNKHINFV